MVLRQLGIRCGYCFRRFFKGTAYIDTHKHRVTEQTTTMPTSLPAASLVYCQTTNEVSRRCLRGADDSTRCRSSRLQALDDGEVVFLEQAVELVQALLP